MRNLLPFLLLAACGGGGGGLSGGEMYTGTYQVTLHERNIATATTIPCTDFGTAVDEEDYIKIIPDAFFDDPNYLEMETCDTDPNVCDFTLLSFEAHGDHIVSPTEGGGSVQSDGEGCALSAWQSYGTLVGTSLRIERKEWYATRPGPDGCEIEDAEALIGTPDCEMNEAWEATRQ
jgi:hypothetical protein